MKIAMKRETLFVFDMTEKHREVLRDRGFSYVEDDLIGNEIWEREEDYWVDEKNEGGHLNVNLHYLKKKS
jgi:hypothetical protein